MVRSQIPRRIRAESDAVAHWVDRAQEHERSRHFELAPLRSLRIGLVVRLGEHVLFDQAPLLPIPSKHRIGVAVWNDRMRIEEIELRGPVRTK